MPSVLAPLAVTALLTVTTTPAQSDLTLGECGPALDHTPLESAREQQLPQAVLTARRLACAFPDNEELRPFLQKHDGTEAVNPHPRGSDR